MAQATQEFQPERRSFFESIGSDVIEFFTFVGETGLILRDVVLRAGKRPFEWRETINQMAFIGAASVPIVALTGFFSGAVLSLYLTSFLTQFGATGFVGGTVGLTVTREIGPVIAGIMVAARCGSAMAAQIGTMAVTEQIDALKMLSVHPTNYLVIPRAIAGVLMLPVLALTCMWAGVGGGLLVSMSENLSAAAFMQSLTQYVKPSDFINGCVKTPVFGLIISIVACQQGLRTTEGAVGVGRATTNTVVISMILVYVANFLLARILFR
jgi:phospholipid/cholesterol/gamma-HCH transport system permease protein